MKISKRQKQEKEQEKEQPQKGGAEETSTSVNLNLGVLDTPFSQQSPIMREYFEEKIKNLKKVLKYKIKSLDSSTSENTNVIKSYIENFLTVLKKYIEDNEDNEGNGDDGSNKLKGIFESETPRRIVEELKGVKGEYNQTSYTLDRIQKDSLDTENLLEKVVDFFESVERFSIYDQTDNIFQRFGGVLKDTLANVIPNLTDNTMRNLIPKSQEKFKNIINLLNVSQTDVNNFISESLRNLTNKDNIELYLAAKKQELKDLIDKTTTTYKDTSKLFSEIKDIIEKKKYRMA